MRFKDQLKIKKPKEESIDKKDLLDKKQEEAFKLAK
jgi:hypothetical protein